MEVSEGYDQRKMIRQCLSQSRVEAWVHNTRASGREVAKNMINSTSRAVTSESGHNWAKLPRPYILERKVTEVESGGPRLTVAMLSLSLLIARIEIASIDNSPVVPACLGEKIFTCRFDILKWRQVYLIWGLQYRCIKYAIE